LGNGLRSGFLQGRARTPPSSNEYEDELELQELDVSWSILKLIVKQAGMPVERTNQRTSMSRTHKPQIQTIWSKYNRQPVNRMEMDSRDFVGLRVLRGSKNVALKWRTAAVTPVTDIAVKAVTSLPPKEQKTNRPLLLLLPLKILATQKKGPKGCWPSMKIKYE